MTMTHPNRQAEHNLAKPSIPSAPARALRIVLAACVAFTLAVPLAPAFAQGAPAKAKSGAAPSAIRLETDPATGNIRLEAKGVLLRDVLDKLAARANFAVEGADSLTEGERVVVSKSGQPEVLLEALLANYNYSIAFAEDTPRVAAVIITGKRSLITTDAPLPPSDPARPRRESPVRVEPPLPVASPEPAPTRDEPRESFSAPASTSTTTMFGAAPTGETSTRSLDQILGTQIAPLQATDRNGLSRMVRQATTSTAPATTAAPDLRDATQRAVQDLQKLLESLRAVEGKAK